MGKRVLNDVGTLLYVFRRLIDNGYFHVAGTLLYVFRRLIDNGYFHVAGTLLYAFEDWMSKDIINVDITWKLFVLIYKLVVF